MGEFWFCVEEDEEHCLEGDHVVNLGSGIFIVQDFKKLSIEQVKHSTDGSQKIYVVCPYGDSDNIIFTASKVQIVANDIGEAKELGGVACDFGDVEAGKLIIALNDG